MPNKDSLPGRTDHKISKDMLELYNMLDVAEKQSREGKGTLTQEEVFTQLRARVKSKK